MQFWSYDPDYIQRTRSIGLPHKEATAACCDEVDPLLSIKLKMVVGEAVKGTDDVKGMNDVDMSNDEVVLDFLQAIRLDMDARIMSAKVDSIKTNVEKERTQRSISCQMTIKCARLAKELVGKMEEAQVGESRDKQGAWEDELLQFFKRPVRWFGSLVGNNLGIGNIVFHRADHLDPMLSRVNQHVGLGTGYKVRHINVAGILCKDRALEAFLPEAIK
ncbi:hypothetical protein Tco_0531976 [Tanacetum coccineum]